MEPDDNTTLGRRLMSNLEAVNTLLLKTASPTDLANLKQTRAKLLEQISTLVDTNLDRATQEYQAATRGLQAAAASIQHAISGMESVAKAVETLAKALDLVAKLIPA